mgnify:CR=1 FL=1
MRATDLTELAAFDAVARHRSFRRASEERGVTASVVSHAVSNLEARLGIRLLNRTTRRQHLTDIGREFYERAKGILADVDAAEGLAAETSATPRGRLRINAPVTFGIHALSPKLPEYLCAHPEVSLELSMTNRAVDVIDVAEIQDPGECCRRIGTADEVFELQHLLGAGDQFASVILVKTNFVEVLRKDEQGVAVGARTARVTITTAPSSGTAPPAYPVPDPRGTNGTP